MVNTGSSDGGTTNAFNVFDALTVTSDRLSSAGGKSRVDGVVQRPQHVITAEAVSEATSNGLMALDFVLADVGTASGVVVPIATNRPVVQTAGDGRTIHVVNDAPRATAIDPAAVDALLFEGLRVRTRQVADWPDLGMKWSL